MFNLFVALRIHPGITVHTASLWLRWSRQSFPLCPFSLKVWAGPSPDILNNNYWLSQSSGLHYEMFFLLSDMTFTHEGNKTFIDGLVNFEKMVSLLLVYMQCYCSIICILLYFELYFHLLLFSFHLNFAQVFVFFFFIVLFILVILVFSNPNPTLFYFS